MSEKEFTQQVIDLAHTYHWLAAHFHQVQVRPGVWITPVKADGKGWPDLVLVRNRVIYAELKTERGELEPEQAEWVKALEDAGQEVYVWRPRDLEAIAAVLSTR